MIGCDVTPIPTVDWSSTPGVRPSWEWLGGWTMTLLQGDWWSTSRDLEPWAWPGDLLSEEVSAAEAVEPSSSGAGLVLDTLTLLTARALAPPSFTDCDKRTTLSNLCTNLIMLIYANHRQSCFNGRKL